MHARIEEFVKKYEVASELSEFEENRVCNLDKKKAH
jgi:hypothetical protein